MALTKGFFSVETSNAPKEWKYDVTPLNSSGLFLLIETIKEYFEQQYNQHTSINHKSTIEDALEALKTFSKQIDLVDEKQSNTEGLFQIKIKIEKLYEKIEALAEHLPKYHKELNTKRTY